MTVQMKSRDEFAAVCGSGPSLNNVKRVDGVDGPQ